MEKNINDIITIPNILSISRIILTPAIFFLKDNKLVLLSVLVVIGVTDVLDGYIARRYKKETIIGSRLDSISDFVFFVSLFIYAMVFEYKIIERFQYYLLVIFVLKLSTIITGIVKYKRLCFLHTLGNKITGIIIFIGFCYFVLFENPMLIKIGILFSIISSFEELIITIFGNEYQQNIKGIWEIIGKSKNYIA